MNNKKRPAVSDIATLARRYSRRISANNNVDACLDACVDDIILSIASYLTSCELLKLALTCKRFGAREGMAKEEDKDDISETNTILSNGSRVFTRPSSNGTTIPSVFPISVRNIRMEEGREDMFMESVIIDHSYVMQKYKLEFNDERLRLRSNKQWIHQDEVVSLEDMKKRVEQSLRFCVKREGDAISISHYVLADKEQGEIEPKFTTEVVNGMLERVKSQLESRNWSLMEEAESRNWSLMEEAALQKSLNLLSEDGCLMWREGESWMGICHQFEQELNRLAEEEGECALKMRADESLVYVDAEVSYYDFLFERTFEFTQHIGNDVESRAGVLAESLVQLRAGADDDAVLPVPSRFFHQYINTPGNKPLEEHHMRGVSTMVGLYENGIGGLLIDEGMGRRIQIALLIAFLRFMEVSGPFIVVAPLSLIPKWVQTFNQYTDLTISVLTKAEYMRRWCKSAYRPNGTKNSNYPVVITSYEVAINGPQVLNNIGKFTYLIMDEGKGFERYRCALLLLSMARIEATYKLFVSADPIKKEVKEVLTLAHTAMPGMNLLDEERDYSTDIIHYTEECDVEKRQQIEAKLQSILKVLTVRER